MERKVFCERARAWAALQSDGELSTFEQRLLDAHLERCAECSGFALRVDAVSAALRTAPLEAPATPVSVASLHRRRSYVPRRAIYSAAAAAAAAVMAVVIGSAVSVPGGNSTAAPAIPVIVVNGPDDRQDVTSLREFRRVQLLSHIAPAVGRVKHFGSSTT
jgi:predicted anti-sigma-YlaC factor YlaD